MQITTSQLNGIMPKAKHNVYGNPYFERKYTIDNIVELLNRYAPDFGIDTPLRWAHYLAQIAHESGEFRYTKELASGAAYDTGKLAKRLGNTPQKDGDGQWFKGRGLIQLTGRANYEEYKKFCGFDVVSNPDLLCQPIGAIRSSMWFWRLKGLNILADKNDIVAITKRINGGTNGLFERRNYFVAAKHALKIF